MGEQINDQSSSSDDDIEDGNDYIEEEESVDNISNDGHDSDTENEDVHDSSKDEETEDAETSAMKKPATISVNDQVFDISFHPDKDILCIGEITGKISVFSYSSEEENKKLLEFKHHKKACRCLSFSPDGQRIYSGSKDQSICCLDMSTGAVISQITEAHENPISSMKVISDHFIASGCDEGTVKIWDTRTFSVVSEYTDRKDYISDITCSSDKKHLLFTSGDGVLSIYNLRKNKLENQSDQLEEELLCLDIIKDGQKVVCGSANGVVNIFSWGEWGDVSDRLPTDCESIESICAVTEDIICTGGDDGNIKAMFVHPHKDIKKIGSHGNLGIECLRLSSNKQLMASCGSENTVRFWDISNLHEEVIDPEEKKGMKRKISQVNSNIADFFADL